MRRVGIVGSEAAKFTSVMEEEARHLIREILRGVVGPDTPYADLMVSGGCHLGGIDIWAVDEARQLGIDVREHLPARRSWEGGYKQRNLRIAHDVDECHCITVQGYHANYRGMKFPVCYHCGTEGHVKSGGCWTVKEAVKLGSVGHIHVIPVIE